VEAVDAQLTPLEDSFSSTLSEGARWINRVVATVSIAVTAFLLLIGIVLSSMVLNQIRNSEEKYRTLIDTANDAILVIDAESRLIVEANRKASELLGIPEELLVGMPESSLLYAREGGATELLTPNAADAGPRRQLELARPDGTSVPVEVSVSKTELAGKPAILGIFRDIRERREAAAVLQRHEERFGHLIQNLSDVITVVAVDSTMLYHSPSVERVVGYKPSMLLGKSFLSFVHPQDQAGPGTGARGV
jgi:PAS domain S-box-containing protein